MRVFLHGPTEIVEKTIRSEKVYLGRSSKCDFFFPNETLSRQHCLIEFSDGDFYITDLGSANGVFINGSRIEPHQRILYKTFEPLAIGSFDCIIQDEVTAINLPFTQKDTEVKAPLNSGQTYKPHSSKKLKPNGSRFIPLLLLPLAIIGLAVYFNAGDSVENGSSYPTDPIDKVVPPRTIQKTTSSIPNEFKTVEEYNKARAQKSCSSPKDICEEMRMDPLREGIFIDGDNIFVFIDSSIHSDLPRYQGINGLPDQLNLIAMDFFLKITPPILLKELKL
jgi:pSer/pThr/pTyr-binding forkhead associated (FHA) protein